MRIWDVYPAIDLRRGRVVRLMQGDPDQETKYADDPLHVAQRWQAAGAKWLHVVNLDGAFGERNAGNLAALECILTTGLRVQFVGGLRNLPGIRQALELGVSRAVIGTAAVKGQSVFDQGPMVANWFTVAGPRNCNIQGGGALQRCDIVHQ